MAKKEFHFLDHPYWAGIGGIATIIGTLVAIWALIPAKKDDDPDKQKLPETPSVAKYTPPSPEPQPEHASGGFVMVNQPKVTHVRVEVDPTGLGFMMDDAFQQKLDAAVDAIAPKIKACFSDYQASSKFDINYSVKVCTVQNGIYVPRNEISNQFDTILPDDDVEKMRDIITAASFPVPRENKSQAAGDTYTFALKLTFVPAGS